MKTGKEADVSLLRRQFEGRSTLLAVKQYRDAQHRMFHRDAGYLEGRRVRRSRENRAMATRTSFGRDLIAGQWAAAEFAVLSRLWRAGAAVPYPVQLDGTELMMEFIGYAHGVLSAYNVLVHRERLVLIDLPQAIDLVGNPQGFDYLQRDCRNICSWFTARGVAADDEALAAELLRTLPRAQ